MLACLSVLDCVLNVFTIIKPLLVPEQGKYNNFKIHIEVPTNGIFLMASMSGLILLVLPP